MFWGMLDESISSQNRHGHLWDAGLGGLSLRAIVLSTGSAVGGSGGPADAPGFSRFGVSAPWGWPEQQRPRRGPCREIGGRKQTCLLWEQFLAATFRHLSRLKTAPMG